jgi:eukaryotic-like serine/threonine-protein kinase
VSHDGEGHAAVPGGPPGVPGVMTFGTPVPGEVLGERYRLDEHVNTDAAGRQIWKGTDTVLRRPVALVVRQPGGEAAAEMLTAAVAASRLAHPHIVGVYDAIDEGHRAYVVREWVPGVALRDVLRQAPLDAERTVLVAHSIAEAVVALHSAGIVHGNIHPGTVLIADDGRVVLTDAHGDGQTLPEADVRAVGALLYGCLTSHWPYAEAGRSALPDAVRDNSGRLATPRQVRGGIPRYLDELTADLLDPRVPPPPAPALAAELARLTVEGVEQNLDPDGPMGFDAGDAGSRRPSGAKIALGVAVLTAIALVGAFIGVRILGAGDGNASPGPGGGGPSAAESTPDGQNIAIGPEQVRVVDPPNGNRAEVVGVEKAVDGNDSTGWETDSYNRANFGGLKPGMGILIDLGQATKVRSVKVSVNRQLASIALRAGTTDPGNTRAGDKQINESYAPLGQPFVEHPGTTMVFAVPDDAQPAQFLLVWITKLPSDGNGKFSLSVNEITVSAA